jgi:hypothetical protein
MSESHPPEHQPSSVRSGMFSIQSVAPPGCGVSLSLPLRMNHSGRRPALPSPREEEGGRADLVQFFGKPTA